VIIRKCAVILAAGLIASPAYAANVQKGIHYAMKHCAECHGKDGKGDGPALAVIGVTTPPADWTNKAVMSQMSDSYLTEIIEKGGKAVGKSSHMPGYASKLSSAQVADLVAYIRSLSE
jgi:mono/diheme cytochrome c family protein